ncbi:pyridoxamine 5'-phosphate oxidase family protein [Nocardioides nitrophenolicus]|uniref:pyridoxamine 5'-phosphate oxidase family protein n=1 Tax=Nocardioides nitrophenolicus TaxID=60489 RepID=UPI0019583AD9|nr:pyridoxamine 5'-phosphate oxidase family protein [Nocardioides nitrophenolicus]MBM7516483.1 general stress protein 26 [Nocardioides nitrophenolicus]
MSQPAQPATELGTQNLEKLAGTQLDLSDRVELLDTQTECTFVYVNDQGWPCGVVMSYINVDGTFWLTAVEGRGHVRALAADQRVSIVVSSTGSGLEGRRMLSVRGQVTVHRDRETVDWFLDRFTRALQPADPDSWRALLDSPQRVVFEVRPVGITASHDQRKIPGNGRGMAKGADVGRAKGEAVSSSTSAGA